MQTPANRFLIGFGSGQNPVSAMDGSDLQEFGYRRGLVLGFTAAEITILLLFLMLLIMGFFLQEFVEQTQPEREMSDVELLHEIASSDFETVALSDSEEETTPEQIHVEREQLIVLLREFETLREDVVQATTENSQLQETLEQINAESESFRETISNQSEELIESDEKYERAQKLIMQLQEESFRQRQQISDQSEELKRVSEIISSAQASIKQIESMESEIEKYSASNRELENMIEQLEQQLQESESRVQSLSEINSNEKENLESAQELLGQLKDKESHLQEIITTNQQLEVVVAKLQQQLNESESMVQRLLSGDTGESKGQDSPCWYESVTRADGSIRERPLYLFDIEIADEFIYAVYPWSGDKRNLLEQKQSNFNLDEIDQLFEEVKFDASVLERPLTFDEFIPAFQQFKTHGRSLKIRSDRRCTFWVAVWDHTSSGNKEGYQKAHEQTVGQVFNTYRFKEDKWPH